MPEQNEEGEKKLIKGNALHTFCRSYTSIYLQQ